MQAVVLAGGRGTRLRPLTYQIPKSMVLIQGRPFLGYLLEFIKSFGINRVLLLIGYLGEQIEEYFGSGGRLGIKVEYSYEETLLGTGGALKNAASKLAKEFLLLNGDTFLPIDYGELMRCFCGCRKIGVVTASNNTERTVPNNIAVGESDLVLGYNKKDPGGMTHVEAGVMVFKRDVVDIIPKAEICSLEEEVFQRLIGMKELLAFPTDQRFYDMGSPEGLRLAEEALG